MRRAVTIATVATLILVGVIIKLVVRSGRTVADAQAASGSLETTMPIYDLHVRHPDIKRLPVQEIPQP